MRTGFFGGSFDPPHLGHLAVARAAAAALSLDSVLFVPTGQQPFKPGGATAPYQDRLAMVSLLCDLQRADATPHFQPSMLEAPLPDAAPNYTVDTLTRLRKTIPSSDTLFAIIGVDAFLGLPTWRSPSALFTLADWIVVSRPGFSADQIDALTLTATQRQHVHLLQGIQEPASATNIRTELLNGSDCTGLLPPSILHYLRARHLYGT